MPGARSFESPGPLGLRHRPAERFVLRSPARPRDVPLPLPDPAAPPSNHIDIFVHH